MRARRGLGLAEWASEGPHDGLGGVMGPDLRSSAGAVRDPYRCLVPAAVAGRASGSLEAPMRLLARLHAVYLALVVLVPVVVAAPLHGSAVFFSCTPIALWYSLLARSYRLTTHPLGALLVIAAIPAQVGYSAYVSGGGLIEFFHGEATVTLCGVLVGLVVAMAFVRPSKAAGVIVVAVLVLLPWLALNWNFLLSTQTWPLYGRLSFYSATLTSTLAATGLFARAARAFLDTGEAQQVELEHGVNLSSLADPDASSGEIADGDVVGLELGVADMVPPLVGVGGWFLCFVVRGVLELM